MGRILYLDCFSGAAGDMLLGAFIDAGLPIDALRGALGSLGVGHDLRVSRVLRAGVSATHVDVVATGAASSTSAPQHGALDPASHEEGTGHSHGDEPAHRHPHMHSHIAGDPHTHEHSHGGGADGPEGHDAGHAHGHHSLAEIAHKIGHSALSDRGKAPCDSTVPAARRSRSRDPSGADRPDPSS